MDSMRVDCPHCGRTLLAPATAFGKRLRCPKCHWAVNVPHPNVPPPPEIVLRRQTEIVTDYHQRLVELYESTMVLIEAARDRGTALEAEVDQVLNFEQARLVSLVEAARRKLTAIIDDAERAARVKFVKRFPNTVRCPHCQKKIRYKDRGAGKSLKCPNPACHQSIVLPAEFEPFSASDCPST
jgi:hypothetical protein